MFTELYYLCMEYNTSTFTISSGVAIDQDSLDLFDLFLYT